MFPLELDRPTIVECSLYVESFGNIEEANMVCAGVNWHEFWSWTFIADNTQLPSSREKANWKMSLFFGRSTKFIHIFGSTGMILASLESWTVLSIGQEMISGACGSQIPTAITRVNRTWWILTKERTAASKLNPMERYVTVEGKLCIGNLMVNVSAIKNLLYE